MNILAIGAHPDDVELGCFGTLLEKKRTGHNVYAVALAPGAYGGHAWDTIKSAWNQSRRILQAPGKDSKADYFLGEFPIGQLEHSWDTVGFVDKLVQRLKVDAVLTHHYGEAHQDHIATQKIAVSAARKNVDCLWLWESSIYTHRNVLPFRAQLYVPISTTSFKEKMEALESYLEAGLLEHGEVDAHRYLARYRGAEMRQQNAEAFEVVWQVQKW